MRAGQVVDKFLRAVESLDSDWVADCFAPGAWYRNVPHPPAVGPEQIRALFLPILSRCERARWDVISRAEADGRCHLERVDRFWIAGAEYSIECHGVYEVDEARGLLTEVRDYVDLSVWRERLGDVLTR